MTVAAAIALPAPALTPLNDLAGGLYLNQFQGGLYPNGSNDVPAAHAAEGLSRAVAIQPLNTLGEPSADGKYALVSIGMSNTTQEFCSQSGSAPCDPWTFMGQALVHPQVNQTTHAIVNGARGGQSAETWDSPTDNNYSRIRSLLTSTGLSEQQVQAGWVKVANPRPTVSLASETAQQISDARRLVAQMGDIVRAMKTRYPNLQQVFLSSRIYAGYATSLLNPEPYAYESGFAVKWLIEVQIQQMETGTIDPLAGDLNYMTGAAPWLAWGPYLWADGLNPRSDGLIWERSDLGNDGTHPAMSGEQKVGTMLLNFMLNSPFTEPWFLSQVLGDYNGDGSIDAADYVAWRKNDGTQQRYDVWRANFGMSVNNGLLSGVTVPEPSNSMLMILGAALGSWSGSRARKCHQLVSA
jgi:hypothetical protein